jgi:hypothetical protein
MRPAVAPPRHIALQELAFPKVPIHLISHIQISWPIHRPLTRKVAVDILAVAVMFLNEGEYLLSA